MAYIGGGFGAKQTAVSEVYPAFVTWKTKKPSKIIFSRVDRNIGLIAFPWQMRLATWLLSICPWRLAECISGILPEKNSDASNCPF